MSRLQQTFSDLKAQGRKALVTFGVAGDPDLETSLSIVKSLPASGADIIELGMPFTDPMADGPAIQAADLRALAGGMTLAKTLELVRAFRSGNTQTPIVLMGYYNPVYSYGIDKFVTDAAEAGVDGLIIVDLPPEEDAELYTPAKAAGLDLIRLVTPTTTPERLQTVIRNASGFLYYVSVAGITGAKSASPETVAKHLEEVRKYTELPLAIGFGIRTPEDAAAMGAVGDCVVVGSSIVENIGQIPDGKKTIDEILGQVKMLAQALSPAREAGH
jgi:tryptophan synthase alpha chain